jgi:hypothetical protein
MDTGHYVFNASAIGLGGVLTSPKRKVIPSLASVALAPTGGAGLGCVTNYNDGDGISFDSAETHVFGAEQDNNIYVTRADVTITNLNVFNELKVASMSASVTSIRQVDPKTGIVSDKTFTFQAEFLGVIVNEKAIDVPVDTKVFDDNPSYDGFVSALGSADMADYRKLIGLELSDAQALIGVPGAKGDVPADLRTICCTAVSPHGPKGHEGFHVLIDGIGKAHLAEVLVKDGRRRLTLLRLDLDRRGFSHIGTDTILAAPKMMALAQAKSLSGGDGSMTIGSVEGNGTYTVP